MLTINLLEFSQFVKYAYVHMIAGTAEAALRTYLRAIDSTACSGGTAEFRSIYECLYKSKLRVNLPATELLNLVRLVRNTIHNGGVHMSPRGTSEVVTYKAHEFAFVHGQAIQFATWNVLADLTRDLASLLAATVRDPAVAVLDAIREPTADSLPPLPD